MHQSFRFSFHGQFLTISQMQWKYCWDWMHVCSQTSPLGPNSWVSCPHPPIGGGPNAHSQELSVFSKLDEEEDRDPDQLESALSRRPSDVDPMAKFRVTKILKWKHGHQLTQWYCPKRLFELTVWYQNYRRSKILSFQIHSEKNKRLPIVDRYLLISNMQVNNEHTIHYWQEFRELSTTVIHVPRHIGSVQSTK